MRSGDTVARLGGDEFAILLGGSPAHEEIRDLAARLIAAVQLPMIRGEQLIEVGLSVGIARAPARPSMAGTARPFSGTLILRSTKPGAGA